MVMLRSSHAVLRACAAFALLQVIILNDRTESTCDVRSCSILNFSISVAFEVILFLLHEEFSAHFPLIVAFFSCPIHTCTLSCLWYSSQCQEVGMHCTMRFFSKRLVQVGSCGL